MRSWASSQFLPRPSGEQDIVRRVSCWGRFRVVFDALSCREMDKSSLRLRYAMEKQQFLVTFKAKSSLLDGIQRAREVWMNPRRGGGGGGSCCSIDGSYSNYCTSQTPNGTVGRITNRHVAGHGHFAPTSGHCAVGGDVGSISVSVVIFHFYTFIGTLSSNAP